jgi:hypothetical protein
MPGRLRIRNKNLKHPHGCDHVQEILSIFECIESVKFNPTTGSVTIYYDPSLINVKEIIDLLELHGYFEPARAINHDQHIYQMVAKAGKAISRSLFGSALGLALEGSPLAYLAILV